jgi:glycosyltransferase involved in cell wall biosynthesis
MLSVLIPVYNYDINALVASVSAQANELSVPFEVVVMDDASDETHKKINQKINEIPGVSYVELSKNVGRAKIRNQLADKAGYNNLLFLDCDSKIIDPGFIKNYSRFFDCSCVVCGGLTYNNAAPLESSHYLRWYYGHRREFKSAKIRNKNPYASFSSFNFMITKENFDKIRFEETIVNYGHEDTLFGYELKKKNVTVKHIDNPMSHVGLESNMYFIKKTQEGIKNLQHIMKINGNEKHLIKDITLLWYYSIIKRLNLIPFIEFLYRKTESRLIKNLTGKNPNLFIFDLYKLGYLCTLG